MQTTVKERIKIFLDYKKMGQKTFEKSVGLSNGYVNNIRKSIQPDKIQRIALKYPELNMGWLLAEDGEMLKGPTTETANPDAVKSQLGIPLVAISAVGGFGNAEFAIKESDVKDYYVIPKFKDRRIDFMIEVAGASMQPKYGSGDVVACTILRESRFIQWGKVHVIGTREQGILIKRLYPCDNNNKTCIKCHSDNEKYPPFEISHNEITGIAIVVGVIRME